VSSEKPAAMTGSATTKMASNSATAAGDAQTCSSCAGKGMAPMVKGSAVDENGVQVIKIGVKDGYYTPNELMVKAGQPVRVVFSGKATGCLAKPTFSSLSKKADFRGGAATIDLGVLPAGSYPFTCGMKMTGGNIVVQ